MKISGLQKLTLLDYPEKTACTVFTAGCNFRCPFCQNRDLVTPDGDAPPVSEDAFFEFLAKRAGLLDGVCVSGGEPLLQPDLDAFCARVKRLGFLVKLDTNGAHPQQLRALAERGLIDYVAMDVKNCPARYAETAGLPSVDLDAIRESVAFLLRGSIPYEFRTTVVREFHTPDDVAALAEWIASAPRYFLQPFRDGDTVLRAGLHTLQPKEIAALRDAAAVFVPSVQVRGD